MKICGTVVLLLAVLHFSVSRYIGFAWRKAVQDPEPCDSTLRVSLVVSSLVSDTGETRLLEARWRNAPLQIGDYLAIYESDPTGGVLPEPVFSLELKEPTGYVFTGVPSYPTNDTIGYETRCLGHWLAYVSPGDGTGEHQILASACTRTRPTWMYDLKDEIGQLKFRDLFIPGSHNSGSYIEGPGDRITKYIYNQEEGVLNQLIFGVRYLDVRIGYYPPKLITENGTVLPTQPDVPDEEVFFINHGMYRIRPLKEVIDDVKLFLSSTKEIVLFDVQEFPVGFDSSRANLDIHVRLMNYLGREFSEFAANVSMGGGWWGTPLNTFWKEEKRLIIGYDNDNAVEEAQRISEAEGKGRGGSVIWQAVQQKWGDKRTVEDLRSYFAMVFEQQPVRVWSAMAEMTPNAWTIITDSLGGLRKMADSVNRNVTDWFEGTWGNYANIVATDYFRGTDIVEASIKWNHLRAVFSHECRKL
ncbi:hypothetical protein J437_LFUL006825 [Ladona fulva]|uniref:Uncharacterized protein n=1 Tax=Ladona fulva TaxID=123851 RepID=A0A8K0JZU2_LADFU|nr:hypothetical protein J437_LFUL006825 [Ladona fulva]